MAREISLGMRTPKKFVPPMIPETGDPALNTFLRDFIKSITEYYASIYDDLNLGKSKHEIHSVTPVVGDLDEGQIVISDVGGTRRIYTRANKSLRYVTLT